MNETVETQWMGKMTFESHIDNFSIKMDASTDHGGTAYGPRPKPLILSSLAGCTGMDIVSILTKKRVELSDFRISVTGELTESHPKYYHKIHLNFEFTGENFEGNSEVLEKVQRAVELSSNNYCGVNAILKKAAEVTYEISLKNS